MDLKRNLNLPALEDIPSPCYLCDEVVLENNLRQLAQVAEQSGCRILLSLKAFAMHAMSRLISQYLHGVSATSLNEIRLGYEKFGGERHIYAPAYREDEFDQIVTLADHVVFNSPGQWERGAETARRAGCKLGVRLNPQYSEIATPLYNPCLPHSRLGMTAESFKQYDFPGLDGLLFHNHCEQQADALDRSLTHIATHFDFILHRVQWVNLGGGQQITTPGYDRDHLIRLIRQFRRTFNVDVYLEPGEAVAHNAGILLCSVLDIIHNGLDIAILDTSATTHMPDVLEMPYRPQILGAECPGKLPYTCRLAGPSCMAGDVIGDYSFPHPLKPGDKLAFCDMVHYTMVKNTQFNGIALPAIGSWNRDSGAFTLFRTFSYHDYAERLS